MAKPNKIGFKLIIFHFRNEAFIQIETPFGGMWRYPLKLVALEPPPDDTITIEAFRLYKESIVGFRLARKSK